MSKFFRFTQLTGLTLIAACGGSDTGTPVVTNQALLSPAIVVQSAVTGQRISLAYSGVSGDYSGSVTGIDLPQFAASAFPGTVNFVTPSYQQTLPARQVQFTFASPGGSGSAIIVPGTYTVGATTGLWASVFYNEGATNGWEGAAGTLVVDSVVGDVVQYRFIDVRMAAGRRFGSTNSNGSFTFNGAGNSRTSCQTAAQCL